MQTSLKRLGIFCGAKVGAKAQYAEAAEALVHAMAEARIGLVYGGSTVGLMGRIADTMLQHKGEVIGVIPDLLVEKEIAHPGVSQLIIVNSMHERKKMIAELSDAFVMLPGGVGSLDEFFEMVTSNYLKLQQKTCAILNVDHYYDHLIAFLDHAVAEKFVTAELRQSIIITESVPDLLRKLQSCMTELNNLPEVAYA